MMQYRNPQYTSTGAIDCEIKHPKFGWISFTAKIGTDAFAEIEAEGGVAEYVAPPEPEPAPGPTLEAKRAAATMPKDDFILAALDAGVLSETDAEEATNGWPTSFNAFFDGQPARSRIKAKARWAAANYIARNAPLIEALADFKDLSPEQVDDLFGIE